MLLLLLKYSWEQVVNKTDMQLWTFPYGSFQSRGGLL